MSQQINSHTHSPQFSASLISVFAIPAAFAVAVVERMKARRELTQLLRLSDHELHDIGVPRHEIVRQSMQPIFWRIGG